MRNLVSIGALLLLVGCGPSESQPAATGTAPAPAAAPAPVADTAPAPVADTAPAPVAEPAPVPAAGAAAPVTAADPARGAATYQTLCVSCHGPRGAGDGPAGQSLVPRPARHDDGAYMNGLSNEHLFRVIKEGGAAVGKSPLMAPWGGALSDAQIRDVVAHVRTLAAPPYTGPQP